MLILPFSKMDANGNDFAVFYGKYQHLSVILPKITQLADRNHGIGFDQLLFIDQDKPDYYYHIYNSDGSCAEQCLNGARCIGRFLWEKQITTQPYFRLSNASSTLAIDASDLQAVTIEYPQAVSISQQKIQTKNSNIFQIVNCGNPHAITFVDTVEMQEVAKLGEALQEEIVGGTNVGFVLPKSKNSFKLITYERGSGVTQSCASNALAAFALALSEQRVTDTVTIEEMGGCSTIHFNQQQDIFRIVGPATLVYDDKLVF